MTIKILGLSILPTATVTALKAAAAAAGHTIVTDETDAVDTAWHSLTSAFPDLVADVKKGIADITSSTLSGGQKAVQVAEDVILTLPDVVKDLPDLKSVVVNGVTKLFSATETSIVDGLNTFVKTVEGAAPATTTAPAAAA